MSKFEKLVQRILNNQAISFREAESLLLRLEFEKRVCGSHHVFAKMGYAKNISLKKRSSLLPYQIRLLQEVLQDHGY